MLRGCHKLRRYLIRVKTMRFRCPSRHPKRIIFWSIGLALWVTLSFLSKVMKPHEKILIRVKRYGFWDEGENEAEYMTTSNYDDEMWATRQGRLDNVEVKMNSKGKAKTLDSSVKEETKGGSKPDSGIKKGPSDNNAKTEDSELKTMVNCVVKKDTNKKQQKQHKISKRDVEKSQTGKQGRNKGGPAEVICVEEEIGGDTDRKVNNKSEVKGNKTQNVTKGGRKPKKTGNIKGGKVKESNNSHKNKNSTNVDGKKEDVPKKRTQVKGKSQPSQKGSKTEPHGMTEKSHLSRKVKAEYSEELNRVEETGSHRDRNYHHARDFMYLIKMLVI